MRLLCARRNNCIRDILYFFSVLYCTDSYVGEKSCSFQGARHLFATFMISLGHADLGSTMRYQHLAVEELLDSLNML